MDEKKHPPHNLYIAITIALVFLAGFIIYIAIQKKTTTSIPRQELSDQELLERMTVPPNGHTLTQQEIKDILKKLDQNAQP